MKRLSKGVGTEKVFKRGCDSGCSIWKGVKGLSERIGISFFLRDRSEEVVQNG